MPTVARVLHLVLLVLFGLSVPDAYAQKVDTHVICYPQQLVPDGYVATRYWLSSPGCPQYALTIKLPKAGDTVCWLGTVYPAGFVTTKDIFSPDCWHLARDTTPNAWVIALPRSGMATCLDPLPSGYVVTKYFKSPNCLPIPFVVANARSIEQPGTRLGTQAVGCTRLASENLGLLYLDNLVIAPRGYAVVEALWSPDCRGDQLTNAVRIARVEFRKSDELVAQSCAFEAEFRSDSGLPTLTDVTFVNTTDTAKALYFLGHVDGHRRLMKPLLAAGESRVVNTMATYVGYSFLVTDTITQPDGQIVPGDCMAIFQLPDAGPNKAVLR